MADEVTIARLHESCSETIIEILDPLIVAAEDDGVHRAAEWVDLLIWNVFVAFGVGVSSNAAFAGLRALLDRNGHLSRPELNSDTSSLALSEEPVNSEALISFETRQTISKAIEKIAGKAASDAQLDEIIKVMRSHLRESNGAK